MLTITLLWLMPAIANTSAYCQTSGEVSNTSATASSPSQEVSAVNRQRAVEAYGRLPLSFEANQGQTDSRVKFLTHGSGSSLFLMPNEAVLVLKQRTRASSGSHFEPAAIARRSAEPETETVIRIGLVGANSAAQVTGLEELPGKSNYFIGHDSTKWRTGIPNYAKVKYANVYPGVDLVYYSNQRQLEFDLMVHPGADPRAVKLDFRTATKGEHAHLRVNNNGDLVVNTAAGEIIFRKPVVYQPTANDGKPANHKELIDGRFVLTSPHQVRFQIAAYDRSKPLVIDPTLTYSTFLGGIGGDGGGAIAVDASGSAYVTGSANRVSCPDGALGCSAGGDVFVSKLNAAGSALLYSTYLSGNDVDQGNGIAVDALGNAYVTGVTESLNFPITPGALQTTLNGFLPGNANAFVSKLNSSGSALLYSTFLGGSGGAGASGIAVDASGNAYVTGVTQSSFPITPGALQTTLKGFQSPFVSKLNSSGSALVYSTYLGGSSNDHGNGIAVDASGNAYVTGSTGSSDFPVTPGAFQTTFGGGVDVFVSKLNAAGSALVYSTFLGDSGGAGVSNIAVDASGNAYVSGATYSSGFPVTPGAFQTTFGGGEDAFVSKLNAAGSALVYSTFLGGSSPDFGNDGTGIAVDASGNAYVIGTTASSNFPVTPDAFQATFGGGVDVFVSKLNAAGSALLYSTYLGGNNSDYGEGIAISASGNAYVTGATASSNFPTILGAFRTTFGGGSSDAFVSKFSFAVPNVADLFLRIRPTTTTVHQGDLLTYAFPVWNLGPAVAFHEVLNTQVPAGTTFDYIRISGTPGLGTCTHPPYQGTGQIVCHENSSMATNTTWTVRLTVKVTAPSGTVITENAATMADTPDPNLANNTATASIKVQ